MNSRRFVQSFLFSRILNLTFRQTRQVYSASYFRFGFGGSGSRFSGTRMSRVRSTRRFLVTKCSFLSVVDVSRLLTSHKGRRRQRREARSTEPRKLKSPETITVNGLFGKNYLNYVSGSGDRIYHPLFPLLESEFLEDCSNVIERDFTSSKLTLFAWSRRRRTNLREIVEDLIIFDLYKCDRLYVITLYLYIYHEFLHTREIKVTDDYDDADCFTIIRHVWLRSNYLIVSVSSIYVNTKITIL